jgi:stage II sporulation protein D
MGRVSGDFKKPRASELFQKFSKSDFLWATSLVALFLLTCLPGRETDAKAGKAEAVPPVLVSSMPYMPMLHPVRIGIATRVPIAHVAMWTPGNVFVDNKVVAALKPQMVYSFAPGRMTELATGHITALPLGQRWQISARDFRIWANSRWWEGTLEIIPIGNSVTVVNLLDLENYLKGVVPSEMPASWHLEALKAQAVAARSYAYAHLGAGSKWFHTEGYDLVPDVRDQAYKGLAAESVKTDVAVFQTRGIILKDAGKVKAGFYRATVGDNPFENLNMRKSIVPGSLLEKITGVSNIVGVTVKQWDADANARSIQVMGAKKTREVYGVALAKMLNFSTAGILDVRQAGNDWVFTYRGPGNGVRGLSQHGANMLAENGWRWEQILHQYYHDPNTQFKLDYMDYYHPMVAQPKIPVTTSTEDTEPASQ